MRIWKIAAVAAVCVACSARSGEAARPEDRVHGYELSHVIAFEVGDVQLRKGDNITINEVRGTADTISAGNTYVIKGTYRLASEKNASLSAYTTGNAADPKAMSMQSIPDQRTQSIEIKEGSGRFSLILYMWYDGNPHVSFYHGNESIGGVYFGTGASVLRPRAATNQSSAKNESKSAAAFDPMRWQIDNLWRQVDAAQFESLLDPRAKPYADELERQLLKSVGPRPRGVVQQ